MINYNLIQLSEVSEGFSNIEIQKYLKFSIKHTIVSQILKDCIIQENGISKVDYSLFQMMKEYFIVNNYSNLDLLDSDVLESYDEMKEKGIIKYVINSIPEDELYFYDSVLLREIDQVHKINNSIEGIIAKGLTELIAKVPDSKELNKIIPKLGKQLAKISPENMNFLADAIGWNNGKNTKVGE